MEWKPIRSIRHLERRLCIPREELAKLAGSIDTYYFSYDRLSKGKLRHIEAPVERLKIVQRRIDKRVLRQIQLPWFIFGAVKSRCALQNAAVHAGHIFLIRIDVRDFFPSISHKMVHRLFLDDLGSCPPIANLLTRLTTLNRRLPQGAPTSPALANLILRPVDKAIQELALEYGFTYTRYVDDLHLSTNTSTYLRVMTEAIIKILRSAGFQLNRKKLIIATRSECQKVTGYVINDGRPSVARRGRDLVQARIHRLSNLDHGSDAAASLRESIKGSIGHIRRTNPGSAAGLERRLLEIDDTE